MCHVTLCVGEDSISVNLVLLMAGQTLLLFILVICSVLSILCCDCSGHP